MPKDNSWTKGKSFLALVWIVPRIFFDTKATAFRSKSFRRQTELERLRDNAIRRIGSYPSRRSIVAMASDNSPQTDDGGGSVSPSEPPLSWDSFAAEYERRVEPFTSQFVGELMRPLRTDSNHGPTTHPRDMDAGEASMATGSSEGPSPHEESAETKENRCPRLLDVGCGTGAATLLAIAEGWEVVATDLSEAMVERTKERGRAALSRKTQPKAPPDPGRSESGTEARRKLLSEQSRVADGQALPSEWSNSFDAGVAGFSVIFFPDPVLGLREILRCLVPGTGRVALTAWGSPEETPAFRVFPDVFDEFLGQKTKPRRITGSVPVLTQLLEEAGFVDVVVRGPVVKTLVVESPSAYYDRFALTSPPTAERLAKLSESERERFRQRVLEVANARGGREDGSVALDSGAYLAYGRKPGN